MPVVPVPASSTSASSPPRPTYVEYNDVNIMPGWGEEHHWNLPLGATLKLAALGPIALPKQV